MNAHDRHVALLNSLKKQPSLSIQEIEALLGASPATVRRDLVFLEQLGKIARAHGVVFHPNHIKGEVPFDRKSCSEINAKIAIGKAAASLVRSGETIFVDAGSTTLEAGRKILQIRDLNVFTNSIPLLDAQTGDGVRLIALGGEVRKISRALVGFGAVDWAKQTNFDLAFVGCSGIELSAGPCTTELMEAEIKRAVISKARRVVLLADSFKWEKTAAVRYASWPQIHDVISNHALSPTVRKQITSAGVRVHMVEV